MLVENFIPGTMDRWGLGLRDRAATRFPRLDLLLDLRLRRRWTAGRLPGYDAILQAMCGLMSINGDAGSGPTRIGVPIVDHLTGYTALTGILLACSTASARGSANASKPRCSTRR